MALHKGVAKRVLRDSGVPTPDFAVIEREDLSILCRLRGISYFEMISRIMTSVERRNSNPALLQESVRRRRA